MKKKIIAAIKVIAYVAGIAFCAACFVDGSEKSEAIEQVRLQQQAHDLQEARMGRVSAFGPEAVSEK